MDPAKQLLSMDGLLERVAGVTALHLKLGYVWKRGQLIPWTLVRLVVFINHWLTKAKLNYIPLELSMACLVWTWRRLRPDSPGTLPLNRHVQLGTSI